jgi:8-oxo-dGTP pyrophosphatase MutT (NUDIX family)
MFFRSVISLSSVRIGALDKLITMIQNPLIDYKTEAQELLRSSKIIGFDEIKLPGGSGWMGNETHFSGGLPFYIDRNNILWGIVVPYKSTDHQTQESPQSPPEEYPEETFFRETKEELGTGLQMDVTDFVYATSPYSAQKPKHTQYFYAKEINPEDIKTVRTPTANPHDTEIGLPMRVRIETLVCCISEKHIEPFKECLMHIMRQSQRYTEAGERAMDMLLGLEK